MAPTKSEEDRKNRSKFLKFSIFVEGSNDAKCIACFNTVLNGKESRHMKNHFLRKCPSPPLELQYHFDEIYPDWRHRFSKTSDDTLSVAFCTSSEADVSKETMFHALDSDLPIVFEDKEKNVPPNMTSHGQQGTSMANSAPVFEVHGVLVSSEQPPALMKRTLQEAVAKDLPPIVTRQLESEVKKQTTQADLPGGNVKLVPDIVVQPPDEATPKQAIKVELPFTNQQGTNSQISPHRAAAPISPTTYSGTHSWTFNVYGNNCTVTAPQTEKAKEEVRGLPDQLNEKTNTNPDTASGLVANEVPTESFIPTDELVLMGIPKNLDAEVVHNFYKELETLKSEVSRALAVSSIKKIIGMDSETWIIKCACIADALHVRLKYNNYEFYKLKLKVYYANTSKN